MSVAWTSRAVEDSKPHMSRAARLRASGKKTLQCLDESCWTSAARAAAVSVVKLLNMEPD